MPEKFGASKANKIAAEDLQKFIERMNNLHADFAIHADVFKTDCKALYEETADALRVDRKALRHLYNRYQAKLRAEKAEAKFNVDVKMDYEALQTTLDDFLTTPLGQSMLA